MSGICGSNCPELDNPPSKTNMGILQIIELVIMGIVAILSIYDFAHLIGLKFTFWGFLSMVVDVLIVVGLVFIILGLFCFGSRYIKIGIYCFFGGTLIAIICTVLTLISSSDSVDVWLLNLLKAILLIFLAYVLWRQSKNVN